MTIRVQAPNGEVVEFPDGTPDAEIERAMRATYGAPPAAPEVTHAGGLAHDPTMSDGQRQALSREREIYIEAPSRRRERAREAGGFPRALSDFSDGINFVPQMMRNMGIADEMGGASAWLGQNVDNIGRRITGRPIEITGGEAYRARAQVENELRDRVRDEQPGLDTFANIAAIPAFAGAPAAAAPMRALRAGATAATINAPFAVARQEGDLGERLPGAAVETAAMFGMGAGLQGLANRLTRAPRPNTGRNRAQQFEDAGVRPTLAAVNPSMAGPARLISENFAAGAGARSRIQASLDDTRDAARSIAQQYGTHRQPEQVGEMVQRGVQRFARAGDAPLPAGRAPEAVPTRDWSFRAKADALYERVFALIQADERALIQGNTGVRATADATRRAIQELQARIRAPNVAEVVQPPLLGRIQQALDLDAGKLRFQDLRAMRTWVREQRARPSLTPSLDDAALARLETALTEDIYTAALNIGGEHAASQLRRVDRFYRAGMNRVQTALQAFDPDRIGGAQAYQRILALAREGGRQDTAAIRALRNSLRPEEWREVAATIVDDLGRVTPGHQDALQEGAFSVERFVTNYARLSPEGRAALFGGAGRESLAQALDNLAQVAGYQKNVERMANASRSGVNVQNVGSLMGLANPGTTVSTMGVLAGMAITGEMLTNPAFVRWLTSVSRTRASPGGMRRQLAALATLASRDPALAPLYADLARYAAQQFQPRPERQPARTQPEPAL